MSSSPANFELEEAFFSTYTARWRRWMPWIRVLDGFRLATALGPMLLATSAVLLWSAGDVLISRILPAMDPLSESVHIPVWPWERGALPLSPATADRVEFGLVLEQPWEFTRRMTTNGQVLFWPLGKLVEFERAIFQPEATWRQTVSQIVSLLWGLAICAFFGGAICRRAALEFSGRGGEQLRQTLRFSVDHFSSTLGSPLLSLVWLGILAIPAWGIGVLSYIPGIGSLLSSLAWGGVFVAGLGMAIVTLGVTAGFPLMVATIATESSDAFDGFSRSFSYLFNRPWYALFLATAATLIGSVLLYFVVGLLTLSIDLATRTVASTSRGFVDAAPYAIVSDSPLFMSWQPDSISQEDVGVDRHRQIVGAWCRLVATLPAAFVFCYFWTMSTILYFLLRLRDDSIPLDEMVIRSTSERKPPLIGIPAATVRERDLQATGTPEASASTEIPSA